MADDPIKLFAGRAERYPQPGPADTVQVAARAALSAVPVLGGPIAELISLVLSPVVQRRRDGWFKELADAVDGMEKKIEGFNIESLAQNEAFVSATIQATRIAVATHNREKREMLRNVLMKIALGQGPEEDLQQVFLSAIEAFTSSHIRVLDFFWNANRVLGVPVRNYGQAIQHALPDLAGHLDFVQHIMSDLKNKGFSNFGSPDTAYPQFPAITNLGISFLQFVSDSEPSGLDRRKES